MYPHVNTLAWHGMACTCTCTMLPLSLTPYQTANSIRCCSCPDHTPVLLLLVLPPPTPQPTLHTIPPSSPSPHPTPGPPTHLYMIVGLSLAANTCLCPPELKGDSRMGLVPNTTFLCSVGVGVWGRVLEGGRGCWKRAPGGREEGKTRKLSATAVFVGCGISMTSGRLVALCDGSRD